ncbi:DUF2213 domain-containing protein [Pseudochelatococcus contaminans]|nr:DUF2213 domain-containing protein [Pseudochelatococcus contaminans]
MTTDRAPATLVDEQIGASQRLTPEGYLLCMDVRIARTGPMLYAAGEVPDLEPEAGRGMITVERDAETLFDPDAILSFAGKPVTNDHPAGFVVPETWRSLAIGTVLNPRRGEGVLSDYLIADLLITDADAISDVRAGKREVSCGYECEREQIRPGLGRQTRIVGNHVALVDRGRCGPSCAIQDKEPVVAKKARTVWDRMRTAFKANDEAAFEEEIEAAQDETGGDEPQKIVIEVKQPEPEAQVAADEPDPADPLAALTTQLANIAARLDRLEGGATADDDPEENAKAETGDDDGEEEKKGEATLDSAAIRDAFTDTLARAEILAPGIKLPTFDARAKRRVTRDALCGLRSAALKAAYANDSKRTHVEAVLGGKPADFAAMSCDTAEIIFRAASELVKTANSRPAAPSRGHIPQGPMTAERYQQLINDRRAKRA